MIMYYKKRQKKKKAVKTKAWYFVPAHGYWSSEGIFFFLLDGISPLFTRALVWGSDVFTLLLILLNQNVRQVDFLCCIIVAAWQKSSSFFF